MRFRTLVPVWFGIVLCLAVPAQADEMAQTASNSAPDATTANVPQTLELGAVEVHGKREVAQALLTIKQALKAPDSTDAAHRNDLVCRFVHEIADPRTYLDCATNSTNMSRRSNTQMARMAPACTSTKCDSAGDMQGLVESLVAHQPGERLHILVNPAKFREMLNGVKEIPATTTAMAAVPAAVTHND